MYFAVVSRPVAQNYINWCERAGDVSRYLFSIGSDPRDERSWTTGTMRGHRRGASVRSVSLRNAFSLRWPR